VNITRDALPQLHKAPSRRLGMVMGKIVYWWWYRCSAGCTHERVSEDPAGVSTWGSEKCPVVGFGAPIREFVIPGPDETISGK
jgi:hypothetical protein